MASHKVIMLPGIVLPPDLAFGALLTALGPDVEAVAKALEIYASDEPPPGYSLDDEIDGVLREADARGWDTFHLVGYSAGGASALAFTARHGDRLASLAVVEPAWAGSWDWSPEHTALWAQYGRLEGLPPQEYMAGFVRLNVKPEVVATLPVPEGPPPPWMAKRPAGISALVRSFKTYDLDRDRLAAFEGPVYFALGDLSNPVEYEETAARLAKVFPDFELEVFEGRHHFDPPHRAEPERLAASLRRLWERAERSSSGA